MKLQTLALLMSKALCVEYKILRNAVTHLKASDCLLRSRKHLPMSPHDAAVLTAAVISTERQTAMPDEVRRFQQMAISPALSRGTPPESFGDVDTMTALEFLELCYSDAFDDPTTEAGFYLEYDRPRQRMTVYFGERIRSPDYLVWIVPGSRVALSERGLRVRVGLTGRDMRQIARAFALERERGERFEKIHQAAA